MPIPQERRQHRSKPLLRTANPLMHGTITNLETKKPILGAVIGTWQASSNGKSDFPDPDNQAPNNLRGMFRCDEQGRYWF